MICFTLMKVDRTENLAKQTKKNNDNVSSNTCSIIFSYTREKCFSYVFFYFIFRNCCRFTLLFPGIFFFFAVRPRSLLLLSLREVIILLQLSYPTFFVYEAVLQREISPSC